MLHVSVSAYKQAEAERRSDPICREVGGGGICKRPGRGSSSGLQYTITTRVDGDVLEVFWSYCSEVGFIKVPRNNNAASGCAVSLPRLYSRTFPECLVCVGLRGMYTAVIMIAVIPSVARMCRHRSV